MEKPHPPPEAALIRLAREAAHISASGAASAAGISTARWSHIENGYETRHGSYKPVTGRAVTIAHMAHAVGLAPARLRQAGRADAADILAEIFRQESECGPEEAEEADDRPEMVRRNWHSKFVRDVWELDPGAVGASQKISLIEAHLEEIERARPGESEAHSA